MSQGPAANAARFVGQRVARKEDLRLLTGRGIYVDDIVLPGMLHVAFVRSPVARASIRSVDLDDARALPGVRAIYTSRDLAELPTDFVSLYGAPGSHDFKVGALANDRVAYVGDPVAMVVADSRYVAEDAAAMVLVDYELEAPVITLDEAAGGPPVHPGLDSNVVAQLAGGDDAEIEAEFARAAYVVSGVIRHQRQAHAPMETRGVVVTSQGSRELTVYLSCQSPHLAARYIRSVFGLDRTHVRVISKDVGGSFGLKVQPWREELAVVAAGLLLDRPVKWVEDRQENLTGANQCLEQDMVVTLAFDADAKLLAADLKYRCNIGAYPHSANAANYFVFSMFPGPYRLPKMRWRAESVHSNTAGWAPYRGPWAMESLARETMLDRAARQMGIDPVELRRRNLISMQEQPYTHPTGIVVHGVTPGETMELALRTLDLAAFRAEQEMARAEGRYLGLGLAVYVEPTAMSMGGALSSDSAQIRVEATGDITVVVSTHSQGHGTQTTMAQIVADQLGVDIDQVHVLEDDSSRGGFGPGAGGSRQAVSGGGAVTRASAILRNKIRAVAGHVLNANPDDISIEGGMVIVSGVPEMTTSLKQIARIAYYEPDRLPPDLESGLEAQYRFRPPPIVFSNAAHACVCEVDAETGIVKVLRWISSEDCGVQINPAVVEGQIAGGVAQAIGSVLLEHAVYDADGNPTTTTFKDYLLPTVSDIPEIEFAHLVTPSSSEGGFKGVGEGGMIIGPPTLVNAVADALLPFGILPLDLPLTPVRILEVLEQGSRRRSAN